MIVFLTHANTTRNCSVGLPLSQFPCRRGFHHFPVLGMLTLCVDTFGLLVMEGTAIKARYPGRLVQGRKGLTLLIHGHAQRPGQLSVICLGFRHIHQNQSYLSVWKLAGDKSSAVQVGFEWSGMVRVAGTHEV